MKYWFIHLILIGVLVAIWVPALAAPKYQEQKAYESSEESEPGRGPAAMPPVPEDAESRMPASAAEPSLFEVILDNIKEIGSLLLMFGNMITFFWQWQDRRKPKPTT